MIGATDSPNNRKVHRNVMPRLGGLAIFLGVVSGYFTSSLYYENFLGIIIGAIIIIFIGILDDIYELSAKIKLIGQVLAALIVIYSGLKIEFISVPFLLEMVNLGGFSIPITIIWIVGITNAINLIDGLDGLAAGVSSIALATIAILAGVAGKGFIFSLCLVVLASTLGFLFYNFYPAKIFMGDTGALFLGYSISVISLLGLYKSVTLFSFIIPIIILGVPISDTAFAIIRRIANKMPVSTADKSHLHHRLLETGLSHKNTVLAIYGISAIFSLCAIFLTSATLLGTIVILTILVIFLQVIGEVVGVFSKRTKHLTKFYKKLIGRQ